MTTMKSKINYQITIDSEESIFGREYRKLLQQREEYTKRIMQKHKEKLAFGDTDFGKATGVNDALDFKKVAGAKTSPAINFDF